MSSVSIKVRYCQFLAIHFGMKQTNLIVGVTGGIAAYKSCELVRRAQDAGFQVRVVMTQSAQAFVTPLTFQALSGNPVHTSLLDENAEAGMGHIELARWADLIVIAPTTANFIAVLASGRAEDLLSTLCLASQAPLYVAPAMNQAMWSHAITQSNIDYLRQVGVNVLAPGVGEQACGDIGPGRMMEPMDILDRLTKPDTELPLAGQRVLITGGPTREAIDPVRFISNHSSGKMAYALAGAAQRMGASVKLISGPVALPQPRAVELIQVESAEEMHTAVMNHIPDTQIFIAAAAVSDYRSTVKAAQKLKKNAESLTLELIRNVDILTQVATAANAPFTVGFAAESESLLENARSKRQQKSLDLIVANDISRTDIGFNSEENECWIIGPNLELKLERAPKQIIAEKIFALIVETLSTRG
jgi:phosphopantothenoylcysteine decarboxylase / phosphopantothenate---cysteine ligase